MPEPTRTQYQVIRYFDGGPVPTDRTSDVTYAICRRNGWIEEIDEAPYHRATDAGRAAMAAYEARDEADMARLYGKPRYTAGDDLLTMFGVRVRVTGRSLQHGVPGQPDWSGWVYDVRSHDGGPEFVGVPEYLLDDM